MLLSLALPFNFDLNRFCGAHCWPSTDGQHQVVGAWVQVDVLGNRDLASCGYSEGAGDRRAVFHGKKVGQRGSAVGLGSEERQVGGELWVTLAVLEPKSSFRFRLQVDSFDFFRLACTVNEEEIRSHCASLFIFNLDDALRDIFALGFENIECPGVLKALKLVRVILTKEGRSCDEVWWVRGNKFITGLVDKGVRSLVEASTGFYLKRWLLTILTRFCDLCK